MQSVDVAIVGGGMVGLAVACGLQGSGLRVAVLEQRVPEPLAADAPPQLRVSAINAASEKLLTRLGVWQDILSRGASCYHGMEVWDKDSFGHISFDDQSMGYSHLGHIVENSVIHYALWNKAQQSSDITLLAPAELQQVAWGENETFLTLKDGSMLTARLVIGADGANSWVRQAMGVRVEVSPYHHAGVVANFATERPHDNIARQWFLGDGILAWLPLPDKRISIVWSRRDPEALTCLSPEALCETVAAAGGYALGALSCLTPAVAFPLRLMRPETVIAERVALAGDAAHTVHPLAGQGVNLGFGDAIALADLLGNMTGDPGDYLTLRRYQRARREAVTTMQLGCDSLFKLFHTHDPVLGWLRNTGLSLTNQLAPVKRLLARQAIGY